MQPINDIPMTLYEAVTRAGGFTSAADQSRLVLVRGEATHWINLAQLQENRKNAAQIMLRDGDLLRVASRDENGVYVMGEINRPMTAIPMKTGKLTLSDALSQAGSLTLASADARWRAPCWPAGCPARACCRRGRVPWRAVLRIPSPSR